MSVTSTKKKSWSKLGTLRKGDDGTSYIKLEANIEIYVDGVKADLSSTKTVKLDDPRKKVEQLRDKGIISEADADKRLEKLAEMSWLRYDLVLVPPKQA